MLRRLAYYCEQVIGAANKAHIKNQPNKHFLFRNSTTSFSSSSSSSSPRKSSSIHNCYLRKSRKWPIQPYKTQWDETFAFQLAKQSFKRSIRKSKTHLLSDLVTSFSAYEINPNPQSYHLLFKILIQSRPSNWDVQVSQILDHIEKVESFETPECMFIDLIKFYGENNMFTEAVELFFRVPKFRCELTVEIFNTLLLVLCRNEMGLKIVPEIVMRSKVMNIRIEESSFEILIRALCRIGKVSNAFELLHHMVNDGFVADRKICSLLLATMCRQLCCDVSVIMGFLEDLKSLGFEPRKDDFCNLMRFLAKRGKGLGALELLKQMKVNGIRPDILCYNLVLDGLILEREFSRADKVFDELLVLGLVPDICAYNVYISGLCMQNKVNDAVEMVGSMEELGCAPDLSTYNTILTALCEAGEIDRGETFGEQDEAERHSAKFRNMQVYETIIDGLIR